MIDLLLESSEDTALSQSFFDCPFSHLCFAILTSAVMDLKAAEASIARLGRLPIDSRGRGERDLEKLVSRSWYWFNDLNEDYVFSYRSICRHLCCDPDWLLNKILKSAPRRIVHARARKVRKKERG